MINLKLSAFADEYSDFIDEQINALKKLSIPNIEVRGVDGKNVSVLTESEVKELAKKLQDNGIGVSAIGSPIGKIELDDDLASHLEMSKRIFETANILGAKNIRMFSFYAPKGKNIQDYRSQVIDELSKLLTIAEERGVTLCHENETLIYGESPESCKDLLDYFGGKLKAVFDMGNFACEKYDAWKGYELLKEHIEYFHIKDALYSGAVVPPGKGQAKIQEILADYRANGKKDTFITMEPHLQEFSGLSNMAAKEFDTPYVYNSREEAFEDAVTKLRSLL